MNTNEWETRSQSNAIVTPTISFEEGDLEYPKSITAHPPPRSQEPFVPPTNSDIESLKSVSESRSDVESWVNEPTTAELEEQLQEKHELAKKLFCKLQVAEKQLGSVKAEHNTQLQEKVNLANMLSWQLHHARTLIEAMKCQHEQQLEQERLKHVAILEGEKQLSKALADASKENLLTCEKACQRLLVVAEKRRLTELAEVKREILKCNNDWTAERESLVAQLEAKKILRKGAGVIVKEYEELIWQAAEARSQLKAIVDQDGKWWVTESANLLPKRLSLGEIAGVIDELRMKLHELVSAEKAQKKLTSTEVVDRSMPAPARQLFMASNCTATEWATAEDVLLHPKADSSQSTVEVGTQSTSKTCGNQVQSANPLLSSVQAFNPRLLEVIEENLELRKRLQVITEKHETIAEKYKAQLLNCSALEKLAARGGDESYETSCYCQGTLKGEDVEVPVPALKVQVRNLRQQIIDITEERKADKEMHEKLRGHYFSLHQKYQVFASSTEAELVAGLERSITSLESQKEALKKKIADLKATHKGESEPRNAINSSLAAKHKPLSKE
jgi:hypothetical protein